MVKNRNEVTSFSPFLRQCFVSFGIIINTTAHGSLIGFTAVLLPQLRLPESYITIDASSASWIASIIGFALLIGNCMMPYLMQRYGRKPAHMMTIIPITIGWFIIIYSRSVTSLIIGRFLQGISMGMQAPLSSVAIGEYTSPKNRGLFLSTIAVALAFGILTSHCLGIFLTWQWTALILTTLPVMALLVTICSPETPSWLVSKNRFEDAKKSFYWLRGRDDVLELDELEVLLNVQVMENKLKEKSQLDEDTHLGIIKTLKKPDFYKPIIIMLHIYVLFQSTGNNVLASYTVDILNAMIGEDADINLIMFLTDIIRLITCIVACVFVKKFKRRIVLFCSTAFVLSSLLSISTYLLLKSRHYIDGTTTWIPTTLIFVYTISLSSGITQIPFTLAGELFPIAYKGIGGGISVLALSSMFFLAVKTAPLLFESIGIHGTYAAYSGILIYVLTFLYFVLPETKDKTLQEIEDGFKGIKDRPINPLDLSDFKSLQSLHSIKAYHDARRCSSPVIY